MSVEAMIALLEMLVAELPEADLLNGLEALRAQDETDTAWFDHFSRVLLSLHQSRAADRRRAVGLTVLGDTAMDLAARRELDELLVEICRRARILLGTDVAYITLTDGNGTFVRATNGIVSEAFRAMRIPLGAGLGGLVAGLASRRSPLTTKLTTGWFIYRTWIVAWGLSGSERSWRCRHGEETRFGE